MSEELSPRRRLFCRQFILEKCNATAAALAAGYSERSAKSQGSQLLALPAVKAEIERLRAADAEAADITTEKLFRKLEMAFQVALARESSSGMVAAVVATAKLAGLMIEKIEDLAARAKLEADNQRTEVKTAANLIAEAAESVGLPRSATPAQIVGALSERPLAPPAVFKLLHEAAREQKAPTQ